MPTGRQYISDRKLTGKERAERTVDEQALIERARRGDTGAFNQIVAIYQQGAYNVAYRLVGSGDSAADATQEAFMSAFRNIRSYRGGSFRAWLLRIVTNCSYDSLRCAQRRPSVSLGVPDRERDGPIDVVRSGRDARRCGDQA